ncbi:MAG: SidA/IucD/PvdA family monooxygenase [Chloroflexi bacterium]|nr:SidA/IucD/PvdA family monooxygenase [Chloroflexota bacterium]
MLDWLIIGGGIHGVHLAHVLIHKQGVPSDAVRILDPHERLLAAWSSRTANTGMRYLRSPLVHHVDLHPASLQRFAQDLETAPSDLWIEPYSRPSYALFQSHCQHVIDTYLLDRLHIRGQALAMHRVDGGWCVETESASITTQRVLLATGRQQLRLPDWAEPLIAQNASIQHVLDSAFESEHFGDTSTVFVLGAGMSAGQIALKLMSDHAVTLITRQPLRHQDFDSSPCWIGPKCLDAFGQANYQERRSMIDEARQPGTLSQDIYADARAAVQAGQMCHHRSEIIAADVTDDRRIVLTFVDGTKRIADHVVLATGLQPVPPEQTWLADAIARYRLPVAGCGYPILDSTLRWAEGLYASGPLAELELGPVAANIAGARAAAERLRQI